MGPDRKTVRPIIVIKKKVSHGGHHGGAWKVAYADFVTAMMSLFIVLWLMNSTPQIKKAVAGYFNDPKSGGRETGTTVLGSNKSISIDQKNVQKLKEQIEKAILKQTDLSKLSKQIIITITSEGLKIDLIEDKGGTFFQSGSAKLSPSGVELLDLLAGQLKVLPNKLLIEGYTDAQAYSKNSDYSNWDLSADRANSARRLLQQGGVGPNQVSQVRGYGDQMLRVPSNPFDPTNRRVSLIVQWQDTSTPAANAPGDANGGTAGANTPADTGPPNKTSTPIPASAVTKPGADGSKSVPMDRSGASSAANLAARPAAGTPAKPAWADRLKSLIPGKNKHS
ncbi:MAG: flagellar motor protein MotB [Acidobacteriaceae bacterium]|jgi:chemotaxis protein MotB